MTAALLGIVLVAANFGDMGGTGVAHAADRGASDLHVGTPITYEDFDGEDALVVTVEEVLDPFEEELNRPPEAGRVVAIRLRVENVGADTYLPPPQRIELLGSDTVLYGNAVLSRNSVPEKDDPSFPAGGSDAGEVVTGLVLFNLPETVSIQAILFAPESDRLLVLAAPSDGTFAGALSSGPVVESAVRDEADTSLQPQARSTDSDSAVTPEPTPAPSAQGKPQALDELDGDGAIQPLPDVGEISASGSWGSAQFGHQVAWDPDAWTVLEADSQPSLDRVRLERDLLDVVIDAIADGRGSPASCLGDQVEADIGSAVGFDAVSKESRTPTQSGELETGSGLYLLASAAEDAAGPLMVRYVECRTLSQGWSSLRVVASAPIDQWEGSRDDAIGLIDAIEMPPDVPALLAGSVEPAPSAPAEEEVITAFSCDPMMTQDERDAALAIWDRVRADLDADTRYLTGHETCGETVVSDESIFVRIEPGDPADFEPGAELIGVTGHQLPGIGDDARLFRDVDADVGAGTSVLSVRQQRDVGELFVRVTLGRPDLGSPQRTLLLTKLALSALPRFPGVVPAPAAPLVEGFSSERRDPSVLSLVDNLLAKERDGEWSHGAGLVASLRLLAGEVPAQDVLRYGAVHEVDATRTIEIARRSLAEGNDPEHAPEIMRLLDVLTFTVDELESMAGVDTRAIASLVPLPRLHSAQGSDECAAAFEGLDLRAPGSVGPCLEMKPVEFPPLESPPVRVYRPRAEFPQAGWTQTHFDVAQQTIQRSIEWFLAQPELTLPGGPIHVMFGVAPPADYTSTVTPLLQSGCVIVIETGAQALNIGQFMQSLAADLALCVEGASFPSQYRPPETDWWVFGLAEHISNLIYPHINHEWRNQREAIVGPRRSLLEKSSANFMFFQFLENEGVDLASIADFVRSMPANPTRGQQETALAGWGDMRETFARYVQAQADGQVRDTGCLLVPMRGEGEPSCRTSVRGVYQPMVIDRSSGIDGDETESFVGAVARFQVAGCRIARFYGVPDSVHLSLRPSGDESTPVDASAWGPVPPEVPESSGGNVDVMVELSMIEPYDHMELNWDVKVSEEPDCLAEPFPCPGGVCGPSGYYRPPN